MFEGKLWIIVSPLHSPVEKKNQSVMRLMGKNKKNIVGNILTQTH